MSASLRRNFVVKVMRTIKGNVGVMVNSWQPPSLSMYADEPGGKEVWHREKRARSDIRWDEYPENDPVQLHRLMTFMDAVIKDASWVRSVAEQRLHEIESPPE